MRARQKMVDAKSDHASQLISAILYRHPQYFTAIEQFAIDIFIFCVRIKGLKYRTH
jgi:hypothetical protein